MGIYICDYCRLDYKDDQYDQAEKLAIYDLVCDSCNVNYFKEKEEENDDRECS